jgi:hypothetical protein
MQSPMRGSLLALLKELQTRVHDAEGERLFGEINARIAELLRAVGYEPTSSAAQPKPTLARRQDSPLPHSKTARSGGFPRPRFHSSRGYACSNEHPNQLYDYDRHGER